MLDFLKLNQNHSLWILYLIILTLWILFIYDLSTHETKNLRICYQSMVPVVTLPVLIHLYRFKTV